jgi:hypothetical protein
MATCVEHNVVCAWIGQGVTLLRLPAVPLMRLLLLPLLFLQVDQRHPGRRQGGRTRNLRWTHQR